MSEVGRVEFEGMSDELAGRLSQVIANFASEKGARFDSAALMKQSGVDLSNTVNDVLMFGCNFWPSDEAEEKGVVIPFKRPARLAKVSRIGKTISTAANVVGALVATCLVAAATTETFNFPGLPVLAEAIYAKNTPERYTRIVESRGSYYRITLARRPGEPMNVVHVVSEVEIPHHELIAMGINPDAAKNQLSGVEAPSVLR